MPLTAPRYAAVLTADHAHTHGDEFVDWVLDGDRGAFLWTETLGGYDWGSLGRIDHAHRLSQRSNTGRGLGRESTVLSWTPGYRLFGDIVRRAGGDGMLAFVESPIEPLVGWARAVGAHDFVADRTFEQLPEDVAHLCERLAFNGNNGYTRGFGHDVAQRLLGEAHDNGILTRDVISATAAFGSLSGKALERLDEMVTRFVPRPDFGRW